jgi:hypothetical protein
MLKSTLLGLMIGMSGVAYCADLNGQLFAQVGAYNETGQVGVTAVQIGGGAEYRVVQRVGVFAEFNYVPAANASFGGYAVSGNVMLAGAGVRMFANPRGKIVRVYVPVIGGIAHATASRLSVLGGGEFSVSTNGSYFGAGLGTEIGSKRFGARPEVRYFRELVKDGRDGNAITAMCGFYFRF